MNDYVHMVLDGQSRILTLTQANASATEQRLNSYHENYAAIKTTFDDFHNRSIAFGLDTQTLQTFILSRAQSYPRYISILQERLSILLVALASRK